MRHRTVIAVDLGAESGRVVACSFDGERLDLEVVHRFPNGASDVDGHLRWDVERLWSEITDGLGLAGRGTDRIDSVGVATWGIDYGLLDADGLLIDQPVSHRDARTDGRLAEAAARVGRDRLYDATGTQLMECNTVFQLLADVAAGRLDGAATLLMVPDLFHQRLSGTTVAEFTAVTTTGAYDVAARRWATELLDDLGIPTHMLPDVADAGTDLGPVLSTAVDHPAYTRTRVVLPGSHDTASAVAAVPFTHPDAAYVSSGTWSLVGAETPEPVVTPAARAANLTNEGGVYGTNRLLRNVAGLWVLQECRRQWAREGLPLTYAEIVARAEQATPRKSHVDVDHPGFLAPGDMPARIRAECRRTGQPEPQDVGEVARCVLESLALRYRAAIDAVGSVTGRPAALVHVVGGGSRNGLLNQLTADVTGLPVQAGPVETTALGNALVQLVALGELSGLTDARELVRAGEPTLRYEPQLDQGWDEIYESSLGHAADDPEMPARPLESDKEGSDHAR
jgi:rhamnulokinase